MNLDYCSCNELDMDHNAFRYYRPEDYRFYAVKKAIGISVLWAKHPVDRLEQPKFCP